MAARARHPAVKPATDTPVRRGARPPSPATGALWPSLALSLDDGPDTPLEREADAAAARAATGGAAAAADAAGSDLAGVRVHTGPAADQSARGLGALAYTVGRDIVFRDGSFSPGTPGGRGLLAHELAHAGQQQRSGVPRIQRKQDPTQTAPVGTVESPYALTIEQEFARPTLPSVVPARATLSAPGLEAGEARRTVTLDQPVVSGEMAAVYAVPLGDLYASPELAAQARRLAPKERERLSLLGVAFQVKGTPQSGSAPVLDSQIVFDVLGRPVTLVQRAGGWGITLEYTKLAVGAAGCAVLRTATGVILIDAGVRHTGVADPVMVEHAMRRLHALVPRSSAGAATIENLLVTHAHLDHLALLDRISREFIVEKITANVAQLQDKRFFDAAQDIAANQVELRRQQLTKEMQGLYDEWVKSEAARPFVEKGVKDLEFQKHVERQVELKLKELKPIEVEVLVPAGTGSRKIVLRVPGLDLVPREAAVGPGGSPVATDAHGTTVLDTKFAEAVTRQNEALATDATAKLAGSDQFSSNHILELPNGTRLLVLSDIRSDDIVRNSEALIKSVETLGGGKVTLWDVSHHYQSGFLAGDAHEPGVKVEAVSGLIRGSHLSQLTETITKMARLSGGQNFATVSADPAMMDPAVVYLLEACDIRVTPAVGTADVQFVAAITAQGEHVSGFTSGEFASTAGGKGLLLRTDAVLEKLEGDLPLLDARVDEERAEQKAEGEAHKQKRLEPLQETLEDLQAEWDLAKAEVKSPPPGSTDTPRQRISRRTALRDQVRAQERKIRTTTEAATAEAKAIAERVGTIQQERQALRDRINKIRTAKEALLKKVKASSLAPDAPKPPVDPARFAGEEKALAEQVDPVFNEALEKGALPRMTETSLVLLGKGVQRTEANAALHDAWQAAQDARTRAAGPKSTVGDQVELIKRLQELKDAVAKRSDLANQKAVEHELQFIDQQIAQSQDLVKEVADKFGTTIDERSPLTGELVRQTVVPEKTPRTAQAEAAPSKFAGRVTAAAGYIGQALGGVMVVQNIRASADLVRRYNEGNANLPETALGVTKSAYGVTLGLRMLGNVHVAGPEFIIFSALDVAQTALGDYSSTAEYNTELAYAMIRNGLSIALMYVGMWLMTLGPWGIIAGLAVMLLGDKVLEVLGVKEWLARKFDPRPDQMIAVDDTIQELMKHYAITIGAAELAAADDPTLKGFGASDPDALRKATERAIDKHRTRLLWHEAGLLYAFQAAYARAARGQVGLKWLDDQRARFVRLFMQVHRNQPPPPEWASFYTVSFQPIGQARALEMIDKTEEIVSLQGLTAADVPRMEQWTKLQDTVKDLEKYLYQTDYDDIEWMKVSEASGLLEQMIANARYRLDPRGQGDNRVNPLIAPGSPARAAYEQQLLIYENKADILRQRQLDMVMSGGRPSGVKTEGHGWYWTKDFVGMPAIALVPDTYYAPDYGDLRASPTSAGLLARAEQVVLYYINLVMTTSGLPEGVTVEGLHSSAVVLKRYRDALVHDGDYQDAMFRLSATRTATLGVLERTHRLLDGRLSPPDQARLDKIDADFKTYEQERLTEDGHYLPEEVWNLEVKVGSAQSTAVASLLGESGTRRQLSDMQHAAVTDADLKKFSLSTIRDRVMKAGIELPASATAPIARLYSLKGRPDVLIGIRPDDSLALDRGWLGLKWEVIYEHAVPVSDAAVAYFGGDGDQRVKVGDLQPVTLTDLYPKAQPTAAPARQGQTQP